MQIQYENEVIEYLNIPSIPRKTWDKERRPSFKDGVAVVTLHGDRKAYAVVTFDAERDDRPHIKKVFGIEPFYGIEEIYVVPSYMDEDVEHMDLDEQSKVAAQRVLEEAHELEMEGVEEPKIQLPNNEYFFDNVHSDEEAIAFIKSYNRANKIKGRVPTDHETIVMKLSVIYSDMQKGKNRKNKRR